MRRVVVRFRRVLEVVTAVAAFSHEVNAQRVLSGRLVDSAGGPVPWVSVEVGAKRTVADDSGRFRLVVGGSGAVNVEFRRIGFEPVRLEIHFIGDSNVVVAMRSLPQRLMRTVVEAQQTVRSLELRGFYRRVRERESGINAGQFITAEEIERRNPHRISQMFEGRSGIKNLRVRTVESNCLSGSDPRCMAPAGVNGCYMTVYLDGIRLTRITSRNQPTLVDEFVIPSHVAGVEIYTTGGRIPPEFQSLAGSCGAILLWTK